ncbi:MAG: chloride channel protein [Bacteroidales bacterium]
MKVSSHKLLVRFYKWRLDAVTDKHFIYIVSVITGLIVGIAAVALKNLAHFISYGLHVWSPFGEENYLYFLFPFIGIMLGLLFTKYIIKRNVKHGVPQVLYSMSMKRGEIAPHNMYSSIVASALTVGFGGSVGLEGPSIVSGAAYGSNIGRFFRLNYRQILLLIGCGSAGVMAAIFNAPIAAVIFVLEVMMLNLSMSSIVPLLLAASSATLMSYFLMEKDVLFYSVIFQKIGYELVDIPSFIIFGVIAGLVSVYFKRMYIYIESLFDKIPEQKSKLYIGGAVLGLTLFFFPSLYGEGYNEINMSVRGDFSYLFDNSIFNSFRNNFIVLLMLLLAVVFMKIVATCVTFGAGGVGGIFAPALFIGANLGLFFAVLFLNFDIHVSISVFVLLGMCGMIAGVLHAPLTGIFLIAELTGGYNLFVPLMLVSAISFATVRAFESSSVYTYLLARRKQLLTHNKDRSVLTLLNIKKLIEKDFATINVNANLGELVRLIKVSHRNIFPVIDDDGVLHGIIKLDDIRDIMFDAKKYNKVDVRTLMHMPKYFFSPEDHMDDVVKTIQKTQHYNFPILDNGKYVGFISRATVFSEYRKLSAYFSEE